jgi:hypothetical protein
MTPEELIRAAAMIDRNGLDAGARVWVPSLAHLNALRAELGEEPLGRDDVPDNIHFADEIVEQVYGDMKKDPDYAHELEVNLGAAVVLIEELREALEAVVEDCSSSMSSDVEALARAAIAKASP